MEHASIKLYYVQFNHFLWYFKCCDSGFKLNPYKVCVWNKDIDGSQFTIIFSVDDFVVLKLTYIDLLVVAMIINKLKDAYSENYTVKDELIITRGKVHDHLGMLISFDVGG